MSALSNVAAHAVLPLGAYKLEDLHRSAEQTDQVWMECDFGAMHDKAAVLQEIGQSFKFPKHYGKNLDALFDCLTELKPDGNAGKPGFVVVLKNLPDSKQFNSEQRDALLDVFRDAADHFYDEKVAFRVFYSVKQ
jgi:RNAse (barnase) inhibitor barstar